MHKQLHEQIRLARVTQNLTQTQVCKLSGLWQGTYSQIESGKSVPSGTTLQKLADVLGVALTVYPQKPTK